MKAFTGTSRFVLLGFFGSHILFTLCLDCQALLPLSLFPQVLLDLGQYEVEQFNDPLMGNARHLLWFQSFVCLELVFQVPFFVAALYYLTSLTEAGSSYPDGFRVACIAYGAHTCTTLVPILATFWGSDYDGTTSQRVALTAMYFPYLAIPGWVLWTAAMDNSGSGKVMGAKKSD